MAQVYRATRKATDEDIIRLNSVGLSLSQIGKELGCHPTTITLRLKQLGIEPADTRRTFMNDIYRTLSPVQQKWLEEQVGPHVSIQDLITNVLVRAFFAHTPGDQQHHAA